MSKLIPSVVAETRRKNTDTVIGYMGLDCELYKQESSTPDVLRRESSIVFAAPVSTQVQIIWSPNIRMLKSLGMYTEEKAPLPIVAYFKFEDDVNRGDYIELDYEYAVGDVKTNKFEVVDRRVLGHGAEVVDVWQIAPKRA